MTRIAVLIAAGAAALAGGCNNTDHSPIEGALVPVVAPAPPLTRTDPAIGGMIIPKSHTIPPGHSADIRKLFSSGVMSYPISVTSSAGQQTQFVQPKPVFVGPDRFIADVPPEFHVELDRLIADMAKSPPAVSAAYDVTYWVIEADAAATTEVPPDLAELAPTLAAESGLGKRRFKSIDRVAVRTLDGEKSALKGRVIQLEQTMAVDPDGIRLQLTDMALHGTWPDAPGQGPTLQTSLQLKPDVPIVLGDSTLSSESSGSANLLLYVVRARRVD
jgi:hypothetical protein